jgi:hypothetical protein
MLRVVLLVRDSHITWEYTGKPITVGETYVFPGGWFHVEEIGQGRQVAALYNHYGKEVAWQDITDNGAYILIPGEQHPLAFFVEKDRAAAITMIVHGLAHRQHAPIDCDIRPLGGIYDIPCVDAEEEDCLDPYVTDGKWVIDDETNRLVLVADGATYVVKVTRRPRRLMDGSSALSPDTIERLTLWVSPRCDLAQLGVRLNKLRLTYH